MQTLTVTLTLVLILFSALAYRFRGMGLKVDSPTGPVPEYASRPITLALSALPIALGVLVATAYLNPEEPFLGLFLAVLVWGLTAAADSLPHSSGIVFGCPTGTTILPALTLLETGLASGAGAVLAFACLGDFGTAALVLLAFALKPLAYFIAWRIPSDLEQLEQGPALGEFLNGLFRALWLIPALLVY